MGSEFGRAWGLSDREEEVQAEVNYGVVLRDAASDFWGGPQDSPRERLDGGGWLRERDMIVAHYPARTTVVNGLERDVQGRFVYEGRDQGYIERLRVAFDRDHVLGDDFESHLPGPPVVWVSADE